MGQVITAVSEDARSAARIVNVWGQSGSGRSRFVDEVLSRLARNGRPGVVLQPLLAPAMTGPLFFRAVASRLSAGVVSCASTLARLEAPGWTGPLDEAAARALANALFQEIYDCGMERKGFVRPKIQRLALVLDGFELLPDAIAVWVAQTVLPLLVEIQVHLDFLLVLVTERSLGESLQPVAWNALPARFLGVEIPPLAEEESVELLSLFARRASEAKMCHAIAEGLPGPMLELLQHRIRPLGELGAALEACPAGEAAALAAVAALGVATREGLRLALGEAGAEAAETALRGDLPVPVFGGLRAGGWWLSGALARIVLEKVAARAADTVAKCREAGEVLEELEGVLGTEEERRMAARLRPFRFFNREVLSACLEGGQAADYERFARAHPGAFAVTPAENLRFADGIGERMDAYVRTAGDPGAAEVRERALRLWAERSKDLERQVEAASRNLEALEHDRDELFAELEKTRAHLGTCVKDSRGEWKNRLDDDVVRLGASLLANGAGVACFWAALFSSTQRLSLVAFGAVLVGIGFGTPALSRRASSAVRARAADDAHRERVSKAQGRVSLLEARTSALQQRIADERRRLDRMRAALQEPFAA